MAKDSAKSSKSGLTNRQLQFCHEYVTDFNATRAAAAAGYSASTAGQIGYENLKKPEIRNLVEELQRESLDNLFVTKAAIVGELAKYAFRGREGSYTEVQHKIALAALRLLAECCAAALT